MSRLAGGGDSARTTVPPPHGCNPAYGYAQSRVAGESSVWGPPRGEPTDTSAQPISITVLQWNWTPEERTTACKK